MKHVYTEEELLKAWKDECDDKASNNVASTLARFIAALPEPPIAAELHRKLFVPDTSDEAFITGEYDFL